MSRVPSPGVDASSKSPGPVVESEKTKRYDRQLRLWGDHGQAAIESARICLINANATGTEILKNLILPGIGAFTIVDNAIVKEEDVSISFFVRPSDVGANRGESVKDRLKELNPDVKGYATEGSIEDLVRDGFFKKFTLVIACDLNESSVLLELSEQLFQANIPFIVTKVNGLFGYFRLQVKEHFVVESKPDSTLEDLRLDLPFAELNDYMGQFNLDTMKRKDLVHVPSLVLIYKYLQEWRTINGKDESSIPTTRKEKEHLKDLISTAAKLFTGKFHSEDPEDARDIDLTNFEEAVKGVNSILVDSHKIPGGLVKLFDEPCLDTKKNGRFYLMLKALKEFYSQYKTLPLRGSIPDMTSDSKTFVELQKIYSAKAKEDVSKFINILNTIDCHGLESPGSPSSNGVNEIDPNEAALFCKNAPYLTVIKTSSINEEYAKKVDDARPESCRNKLARMIQRDLPEEANEKDTILGFYLMFRSVEKFYSEFNRFPGEADVEVGRHDVDINHLRDCLKLVLAEIGAPPSSVNASVWPDLIEGFVVFGGSEIHTVAAFLGGISGQEAIKLITGQFVPVNHTLIYNGITCKVETLNF